MSEFRNGAGPTVKRDDTHCIQAISEVPSIAIDCWFRQPFGA